MGIEPTLSAWKAEVLPLNYTRESEELEYGGGGRIRTYEGISRQIYSLLPLAARALLKYISVVLCKITTLLSILKTKYIFFYPRKDGKLYIKLI